MLLYELHQIDPRIKKIQSIDGITIYLVDGYAIRQNIDVDFIGGGHHYAYPKFIPENEIWIEDMKNKKDVYPIIAHELKELHLMRDKGKKYDDAHEVACDRESETRAS